MHHESIHVDVEEVGNRVLYNVFFSRATLGGLSRRPLFPPFALLALHFFGDSYMVQFILLVSFHLFVQDPNSLVLWVHHTIQVLVSSSAHHPHPASSVQWLISSTTHHVDSSSSHRFNISSLHQFNISSLHQSTSHSSISPRLIPPSVQHLPAPSTQRLIASSFQHFIISIMPKPHEPVQ